MTSLVNGITADQISVFDRGLLYGHSVFETLAVQNGTPLMLEEHLQRLAYGCNRLSIGYDSVLLRHEIQQFCDSLTGEERALSGLRITLTIGEGGRGYKTPTLTNPNRILTIHPFPDQVLQYREDGIHMGLSDIRLGGQELLAGIKHGNRLEQILARDRWHSDWQEAVLLDTQDNVVEATQSNLFVRHGRALLTPDLKHCGVAGVVRDYVLHNAQKVGVAAQTVSLSVADIQQADEVFVTNSIIGLWPVKRFQDLQLNDFSISRKLLHRMQEHGAIPTR